MFTVHRYLEEGVAGDTQCFHGPVRDLVEERGGCVVLLHIDRGIRLVRIPRLRSPSIPCSIAASDARIDHTNRINRLLKSNRLPGSRTISRECHRLSRSGIARSPNSWTPACPRSARHCRKASPRLSSAPAMQRCWRRGRRGEVCKRAAPGRRRRRPREGEGGCVGAA